jgi:transcriptional regulator with XRE-family HTH domain
MSYSNFKSASDSHYLKLVGKFIKHHRVQLNLSQNETASRAGISRSTLSLLERGQTVRLDTLIQILRTLDLLSVLEVFEIEETISPVAYAKLKSKERKRARKKDGDDNQVSEPEW